MFVDLLGPILLVAAIAGAAGDTSLGVAHHELPHVKELGGLPAKGPMIPLPPSFFFPIMSNSGEEPVFDPSVHLALEMPAEVALTDTFDFQPLRGGVPRVTSSSGSQLAFTQPFQMFSDEGVRVLKSIIMREAKHAHRNHRNIELRGLYYRSEFVRTLMTDETLLRFLERLIGEPVQPHFLLMDAPSVNFGILENETVIKGVVDPWHFDSVAYVGVALVSDMTDMVGGELQLVKRSKEEALDLIYETGNHVPEEDLLTVGYKQPGYCILVQGSEVFHRVTRVQSAREPRLSLIMAFQPANPFQPDKTVLDTWKRFDMDTGSAPYEFYRLKAQTMGSALHSLAATEAPTKNTEVLARRLRAIAAELERTASLLDGSSTDFIGFVNETQLAATASKDAGTRNNSVGCASHSSMKGTLCRDSSQV